MMPQEDPTTRWGKIRWGLAALLLGLPLPVVLIAFILCGSVQMPQPFTASWFLAAAGQRARPFLSGGPRGWPSLARYWD